MRPKSCTAILGALPAVSGAADDVCRDGVELRCRTWYEWGGLEDGQKDERLCGGMVCWLGVASGWGVILGLASVLKDAALIHACDMDVAGAEPDELAKPAARTAARCKHDASGSRIRTMLKVGAECHLQHLLGMLEPQVSGAIAQSEHCLRQCLSLRLKLFV